MAVSVPKSGMPIVATSQRIDVYADRNETRDALDQRVVAFLAACGCLSVPISNAFMRDANDRQDDPESGLVGLLAALQPDAVVLSGGNDIGAFPERDATEARLLAWAREHALPVLGICRGFQMMAHWEGAELIRTAHHVRTRHRLTVTGPVDDWPVSVNSFHDWALMACPDGYDVTAYAEDGTIEAVVHRTRKWEGWMWHPEREAEFSNADINRVKRLFKHEA